MKANRALREGEPDYNLAEELISAISHGLGALFGVAALVLGLLAAADDGAATVVGAAVYGGSMGLLYTCSTIYHSLRVNMAKRVFRILDHCGVFLLIAGTYTPLLLVSMYSQSPTTAVVMLVLIWAAAAVGIVFSSISLRRFRVLTTICYLTMGWSVIFTFSPMMRALGPLGTRLLVWGGVAYTLGAVLYGIGAKKRYFHSIFHFFVLAGSILHFLCIYLCVL